MSKYEILNSNQCGFWNKLSIEDAIINVNYINRSIDKGVKYIGIFWIWLKHSILWVTNYY